MMLRIAVQALNKKSSSIRMKNRTKHNTDSKNKKRMQK